MDFHREYPVPLYEMCSRCGALGETAVPGIWECPDCRVVMSLTRNALNNMQKYAAQNTREWKTLSQNH